MNTTSPSSFLVNYITIGIIDIFDMAETLIKLRKLYNLPVIDIYGKKESNSSN